MQEDEKETGKERERDKTGRKKNRKRKSANNRQRIEKVRERQILNWRY